MSLFINTNISSLYAQRAAQRANDALDSSYEKITSGYKINQAKDDAAGIQVANNLTTQLNGLTQGNRNAQDAIAFAQTVEGAMDEVTNMLQRIRTLAIQSANGTMTDKDRKELQVEVDQLNDEICRIANETTFAGSDILNGSAGIVRFQVGPDPSSIVEMDLTYSFDVNGLATMAARYEGDTFPNPFDRGPNGQPNPTPDPNYPPLKFDDIFSNNGKDHGIDLTTQENAQYVLAGIDSLITVVDRKRSELGAMQNRLEATVRNQENIKENVANSRSTIRDTDFAEEVSNLTSQQIIQQATSTILTQANQRPQVALSLLSGK